MLFYYAANVLKVAGETCGQYYWPSNNPREAAAHIPMLIGVGFRGMEHRLPKLAPPLELSRDDLPAYVYSAILKRHRRLQPTPGFPSL